MALGSPLDAELLNIRYAATDIAMLEETVRTKAMELETRAEFELRQAKLARKAGKIRQKKSIFETVGDVIGDFFGNIF